MKENFAIAIMIGSPYSRIELVKKAFLSIRRTFSPASYRILLQIGTKISNDLLDYLKKEIIASDDITLLGIDDINWSEFINHAIDEAEGCRYFIKSHDDIELLTPNFDALIENFFVNQKRDVGWISFTDIGYKYGDFSPPVREGYFSDVIYSDAFNKMTVFQFHSFPSYWTRRSWFIHYGFILEKRIRGYLKIPLRKYPKKKGIENKFVIDLPKAPVKCHAPFNHFVLIKYEILRKIGYCENWGTKNALLVDEDWGLRALEMNFPNVWIPTIEYLHNRGDFGEPTRSWRQISVDAVRVGDLFYRKWGFHETPTISELEMIKKKYGSTLIPWSIGRKSYEWDYLDADA